MTPNPMLGVFLHWLGGLASASFYVPFRGVKAWAWETYWLVGGIFSWVVAPWLLALAITSDLPGVLRQASAASLFWTYFFGVLWGLGGLTFGLTMRYLGMSLGMAVALGFTAAFGTLMPPIFRGEFATEVLGTHSGMIILLGVVVCLLGIAAAGAAGVSKEKELSEEQRRAAIKEFDLRKGLLVATFSGVMSACFAYGLAAGDPIKRLAVQHGTPALWQGLPVLVVLLAGGFTTNFIWCLILNVRNHTGYQYFSPEVRKELPGRNDEYILESPIDAPAEEMAVAAQRSGATPAQVPMLSNYFFSALAGSTWYFQFFFYTMGETKMGRFRFSSWTLHMASIIIFSTLWGIALKEWSGVGRRTRLLVALTLLVLVGSTLIVGYGNYVAQPLAGPSPSLKGVPEGLQHIDLNYGRIPLAVVSGSRRDSVTASLKSLGLLEKFGVLVCAEDYKKGKPDPEPFLLAAERLRVTPQSCLVFEDADIGIEAAKSAGMSTVRVSSPWHKKRNWG